MDTGSIPIFVAERLDSRYLPPLVEIQEEAPRDDESGKSTLPRGTAQIPKTAFVRAPPGKSRASLVATILIVLILLTAAFLAGRYLKF